MPRSPALLFLFLFLAACNSTSDPVTGVDAKPLADSGPVATTTCANPVPTTATDTVVISGVVTDGSFTGTGNALVGATLAAFRIGGATLGTDTTQNGGIYQVTATTGGLPIEYLAASNAGYTDSRFFPRAALGKATSMPKFPLFATADAAAFPTTFGVTQDPAKGVAVIFVFDCQGSPIANATVTVSPPGSAIVKYMHADNSTTGTATDSLGVAFVFDVGAGTSTIDASSSTHMMHAHTITAGPSYLTLAMIAEQ